MSTRNSVTKTLTVTTRMICQSGFFYQPSSDSQPVGSLSVFDCSDNSSDDGGGPCPLSVCGLTDSDLASMSHNDIVLKVLQHLRNGGNILSIGQRETPQSVYDNLSFFTGMMPWLFHFGFGEVDNPTQPVKIPRMRQIRAHLSYCNRRFQEDVFSRSLFLIIINFENAAPEVICLPNAPTLIALPPSRGFWR
jgi:hypothetical protein